MRPLAQTFRVGGWDFTIIERVGDVVLARKVHPDVTRAAYEVAIVQRRAESQFAGRVFEAHEAMPGAEAFGRVAWAPSSLAAARERFDSVVASRPLATSAAPDGTGDASEAEDAASGESGPNVAVCRDGAS